MKHDPHLRLDRLTAAMIRGNTELRLRVDAKKSCVLVEMNGTPHPALMGVTVTGAENLHTSIATGLADLITCQQKNTGDQTQLSTDG